MGHCEDKMDLKNSVQAISMIKIIICYLLKLHFHCTVEICVVIVVHSPCLTNLNFEPKLPFCLKFVYDSNNNLKETKQPEFLPYH